MRLLFLLLAMRVFSCTQKETSGNNVSYDVLENLYHQCDTIIRKQDTLVIVNTKFDTTITETGIFTYMQYDYPLTSPHEIIALSQKASLLEQKGQKEEAMEAYEEVVDFYQDERPDQLKNYSDMNGYLQYEVNAAILASYAYERLEDNDNALKTLQPFLANVEASNSRIHERYIQLCIGKYGIEKVRQELNNCGKTIQLKKQDSPEIDDWVVSVFGADIGVGNAWATKSLTGAQADTLIREMEFYKLSIPK